MKLKELLQKKKTINEAEEVKFDQLDKNKQKDIIQFEKILGGKRGQIFDGIHGNIVDIKTFGRGYRFDTNTLKKLLSVGIRWMEADGDTITIAF